MKASPRPVHIFTACLFASLALQLRADTLRSARTTTPSGVFLSREEFALAKEEGLAAAKEGKPATLLLEDVRREPVWTTGKRGPARDCSVWFTSLGGADFRLLTHRVSEGRADTTGAGLLPHAASAAVSLDFDVVLRSIPRDEKTAWHRDPSADAADVRAESFEIADDRGNTLVVRPAACGVMGAEGSADIGPVENVAAAARAEARDQIHYTPASLEFGPASKRPYYEARYHVHASLWDKNGRPRVSPDARKIRLTIVTLSGRMTATYTLPAPNRADRREVARVDAGQ